jgi:hypothetical protein
MMGHWYPPGHPDRRRFLIAGALGACGLPFLPGAAPADEPAGELLPNGIRLPSSWPPRRRLSAEPMPVPYLDAPPAVLPIDLGRQLFVDDFLVADTTLRRTFHQATYHPATPVLRPDRDWERTGRNPAAMVFSDGVWYDPRDRLFKLWYMGGIVRSTCYATSRDGLRWDKPALDVRPGTNVVHPGGRDSATVWLDPADADPRRRFKLFRSVRAGGGWALALHVSADGIHWADAGQSGPCGDRTTVFYNPFRRVWVYSVRTNDRALGRTRGYREGADALRAAHWADDDVAPWVGADRLDPPRADLRTPCELYNLDAVAYESILLGLFSVWRGQPRDRAKPNEVVAAFSRDGFHWARPSRRALLPVSERPGDWNWGNVQSAGGCCLVVGDRLYFYCSGRAGVRGTPESGVCSTGLATLRRDGFASMDAGAAGGTLTTRPVRFGGRHLFVNADPAGGTLRVEVLSRQGEVVAPFTRAGCVPVRGDGMALAVRWQGGADLGRLAGQAVRFRFHLEERGRLYAFWVSRDASGASGGYVAAGGPGFQGPTDTVGTAGARSGGGR